MSSECYENNRKLELSLGDGFTMVAEKNIDSDYKEVFVYLRDDSTGCVFQDLAVIGERYTYSAEAGDVQPIHGQYSVKIYSDPDVEDWTMEYNIFRYEEERS